MAGQPNSATACCEIALGTLCRHRHKAHNIALLTKLKDREIRLWYATQAIEYGWSRKVLEHHIATKRYEREGKALTNFSSTLPAPESELVQQIVHEDYNFEFLGLTGDVHERRLERSLVAEIEYAGQVNFYVDRP